METNQGLWQIPGKRVAANLAYGEAMAGGSAVALQALQPSMSGMLKPAEAVLTICPASCVWYKEDVHVGCSVQLWRFNAF